MNNKNFAEAIEQLKVGSPDLVIYDFDENGFMFKDYAVPSGQMRVFGAIRKGNQYRAVVTAQEIGESGGVVREALSSDPSKVVEALFVMLEEAREQSFEHWVKVESL